MIGVHLQLFNGTTPQASLSGLKALWWNHTSVSDFTSPAGRNSDVSTDSSGYVDLDLSAVSALSVGGKGFLMLYQPNIINSNDALVFSGVVAVSDITSGAQMAQGYTKWTRPSDWLTMPTVGSSDQKFVGLLAVYDHGSNHVAISAAENYTVDWGDGSSTENIASGVTASHVYTYSGISDSTLCTRGYKQVLVTVVPQSGKNLTTLNLQVRHANSPSNTNIPWLDIALLGFFVTANPGEQAVDDEFEGFLLEAGFAALRFGAEHSGGNAVDAGDFFNAVAAGFDELGVLVAHSERGEAHAFLGEGDAASVVGAGIGGFPLTLDSVDGGLLFDGRCFAGPGDDAGRAGAVGEDFGGVAVGGGDDPEGFAVHGDGREADVGVVADPADVVDLREGEGAFDAVGCGKDAVVGHAVEAADEDLDAIGVQGIEPGDGAVGGDVLEADGVAAQAKGELFVFGELEGRAPASGAFGEEVGGGVIGDLLS